jgi:GWxTD domain-containing protein
MTSNHSRTGSFFGQAVVLFLLCLVFFLLLNTGCHYYNLSKKLTPEYADFFEKVRYIITNQEEKMFLDLPDSEKDQFVEEFWKRRDPSPRTEENEFKMLYFDRIEKANALFVSEGKPGWLTDRGRIYILYGPPLDRFRDPMGQSSYRFCQEIWYYGNFPVVFADRACIGDYQLVTYNLSQIRSLNLMYLQEMNIDQDAFPQSLQGQFFNFEWSIHKTHVSKERIEGFISINIPYANIWYAEEDGYLRTVLDIHLELKDAEGRIVWEHDQAQEVKIEEEELTRDRSKKFYIEIPFMKTGSLERLIQGSGRMLIILKNRTGGSKVEKYLEFKIKSWRNLF